jgi:sugar O-acyltransferase (sialic acid O-acetyltransferase NeuD family)
VSRRGFSPVAVIGAGGHARVVISTLSAAGFEVAGVFDDDPVTWGTTVAGIPVRGPVADVERRSHRCAVVAIGDNSVRDEITRSLPSLEWTTVVHPAASVDASARLGPGAVVCAGAIIQPAATIGAHVIINTAASVDHDCTLEEYAHLAPGVRLAGGVRIGRGALLGIGSVVIPNLSIGEWTVVGAGAVVVRDLPPRVTAVGVPARPVQRRPPAPEAQHATEGAAPPPADDLAPAGQRRPYLPHSTGAKRP